MFPGLLNATAAITRQEPLSGATNGRTAPTVVYTNVPCLIMPMNHRTAIDLHFDIGRANDIYFNDSQDLRPEDVVTINGNTYVVSAVQSYAMPLAGYVVGHAEQEIN